MVSHQQGRKAMKTVTTNNPINTESAPIDMKLVRERVKRIKESWNDQTAKQRAEEGKRRRAELERLLFGSPVCLKDAKCDFTLVV
jgi:hypothetical protein